MSASSKQIRRASIPWISMDIMDHPLAASISAKPPKIEIYKYKHRKLVFVCLSISLFLPISTYFYLLCESTTTEPSLGQLNTNSILSKHTMCSS